MRLFNEISISEWSPHVDVYRGSCGWVLKFDLAGVKPQDVSIEVSGASVRVKGVRRDWMVEKGLRHHSMEISYNRFERSISLPSEVEGAPVSTEYLEGMLIVRFDSDASHADD